MSVAISKFIAWFTTCSEPSHFVQMSSRFWLWSESERICARCHIKCIKIFASECSRCRLWAWEKNFLKNLSRPADSINRHSIKNYLITLALKFSEKVASKIRTLDRLFSFWILRRIRCTNIPLYQWSFRLDNTRAVLHFRGNQ